MFHHSVDTCAVVVRALYLGWSGPSRVNDKQASYQYTQLTTMGIIADYMEYIKFRHFACFVSGLGHRVWPHMAQISPGMTLQWEQGWERVLWKKKPYPDNYVPRTRFLESIKTNGTVEPH